MADMILADSSSVLLAGGLVGILGTVAGVLLDRFLRRSGGVTAHANTRTMGLTQSAEGFDVALVNASETSMGLRDFKVYLGDLEIASGSARMAIFFLYPPEGGSAQRLESLTLTLAPMACRTIQVTIQLHTGRFEELKPRIPAQIVLDFAFGGRRFFGRRPPKRCAVSLGEITQSDE